MKQKNKSESKTIHYSTEKLKELIESGKIPMDIGEWELRSIEDNNKKFKEWQQFIKDNPHLSETDRASQFYGTHKTLPPEEALKMYNDMANTIRMYNLLSQSETQNIPAQFFKTIGADEFGISRLMADPINNLPNMLETFTQPQPINEDLFVIQAKCENSLGDEISLEYRYRAANKDEANLRAKEFIHRLTTRQKKVYGACWALVNKRMSRIVACDLTELMLISSPDRKDKNSFSTEQKIEFFQDLLDLSQTQLMVTKTKKVYKKKHSTTKFLLPFITIYRTSEYDLTSDKNSNHYPNNLTYAVLHNPLYEQEKMYNVGAGIKYKTFELRPEDSWLAQYIQIRKSQCPTNNHIVFADRDNLLKIAGLDGIKHTGMANKRLIEKLARLRERGIIAVFPERIAFPLYIKTK